VSDAFGAASVTVAEAFARYEAVRARLPAATFPPAPRAMAHLGEAADLFDGFVLDAYGVLNVGDTPVPGAVARMAGLRARGVRLCVLSNAASYTRAGALRKFRRLGFDFAPHEIVTSRDVAAARLNALAPGAVWAVVCAPGDDRTDLPVATRDAVDDPDALRGADGVLVLSAARYDAALHARMLDALVARPRPLVVANPDLVSPQERGLVREPGWFAHDVMDRTGAEVTWFGKPFADGFDDAVAGMGLPRDRLAMVGDTLHTDVLGGRAAGLGTILVTQHGIFTGTDAREAAAGGMAAAGIVPDVVVPTT
jgi:HAD superfamily hydrolase (TIGR01459 family)